MATVMTNAQRTHADKALAGLEQSLIAVLNHGVASSERDQLTAELSEIRSQRQALGEAHPNEAYRWTKAATARTKKLRRKHPQAHTSAQRSTSSPKNHRSPHCTNPTPHEAGDHSPTGTHQRNDTPPLVLPHTDEHRELISETTQLLLQRKARLHRSARVTVGALRTAILTELQRVDADLRALPRMSHRKSTACRDHHQHAEDQWNDHGADVLIRPLCHR
ncbi:hypothetical protein ACT3SZ_15200 [Corynebacterium sp. AOP40-9SA-29]|uniref:hypothetical protein n=1 Tax=Corynebacterium sp. AOP40-9SA-29 TaxID=3457677 RepID=UPI004034643D